MKPTKVFITYAQEDTAILKQLRKHLSVLERSGKIAVWYDGEIIAGKNWAKETDKALNEAHIILMLISSDFIFSDFCYKDQMKKALARHKKEDVRVIPIIVRDCVWDEAPFSHIQPLPLGAVHTTSKMWDTKDEPYVKIVRAISTQIEEYKEVKAEKKKQKKAKKGKKQAKPTTTRKQGRILYRIPNKMELKKVASCTIRIAPEEVEEAILKENLKDADNAIIEDLRKIGKYMRVRLLDESNSTAFDIRCKGEEIQLVEEDDYTEWLYDVTPKLAGKHRLELQVAIVTKDKFGEEYKKNIVVLDKIIEIVAEEVQEKSDWERAKKQSAYLLIPTKKRKTTKNSTKKTSTRKPQLDIFSPVRSYAKMFSIGMLFVLFTPTITWAIAPQVVTPHILDVMYDDYKCLSETGESTKDCSFDSRIAVEKDGKWGVVNKWGRQAIEPQYEEIKAYENGVAQVKKDGKWGAIKPNDENEAFLTKLWSPKDKEVVPTVADTILSIDAKTNKVAVKINNKDFTLPMKVTRKVIIDEQTVAKKVAKLPTNLQKTVAIADSLFEIGDIEEAEKTLESLETKAIDKVAAKNLNVILEAQKTKWSDKYVENIYETAEKGETEKLEVLEEALNDIEQLEIEEIKPTVDVPKETTQTTAENDVPKPTIDTTTIVNTPTPTIEQTELAEIGDKVEEIIGKALPKQKTEINKVFSCTDGKKNGNETGIDCGGPDCGPCPSCYDGKRNQDETGIDCGGSNCVPCPTCFDGKRNQGEKGIDCGGPCSSCLIADALVKKPAPTSSAPRPIDTNPIKTNTPPNETSKTKTDIPAPIQKLLNDMVRVEGGTFRMGCDEQRDGPCDTDSEYFDEFLHDVTLSSYQIGKYEVTQAQWQAVMGNNPSKFQGCDNCPVEKVSWNDIQDFLKKLNSMTGKNFRLPTEAEWEYAARGGNKSNNTKYAGSNNIDEVAWYGYYKAGKKTHEIGSKGKANELGLYDMTGNVDEWCEDWYDENYYTNSPSRNPKNLTKNTYRVLRGGGWNDNPTYCRVANRINGTPTYGDYDIGFRLASSL